MLIEPANLLSHVEAELYSNDLPSAEFEAEKRDPPACINPPARAAAR
jgi:hypothetical protein